MNATTVSTLRQRLFHVYVNHVGYAFNELTTQDITADAVEFRYQQYGSSDVWITQKFDVLIAEQVGIQFARICHGEYGAQVDFDLVIFEPGQLENVYRISVEAEMTWKATDARQIIVPKTSPYLQALEVRWLDALEAEEKARPQSDERRRLGQRTDRLSNLKRAVARQLQRSVGMSFIPFRSADAQNTVTEVLADVAYRAAPICQCGNEKDSGEIMCAQCGHAEMLDYNRDYDEEERHERLMACLPDGDYTASEMAEYLS